MCRKEFEPIPWGFMKLVLGILAAVSGIGAGFSLWQGEVFSDSIKAILWGYLGITSVFAFMKFADDLMDSGIWPFTFIRAYWCRNVLGYEVHYWRDPENVHEFQCKIYGFGLEAERCPIHQLLRVKTAPWVHVVAPLGGWFGKPRLYFAVSARIYSNNPLPEFTLKRIWGHRDHFWLIDGMGMRLRIYRDSIFWRMERLAAFWRAEMGFCHYWGETLWVLLNAEKKLRQKLQNKEEMVAIQDQRLREEQFRCLQIGAREQTLRDLLGETVKAISDTKRFSRSKEAKEIRERLAARLKEIDAPPNECPVR